jgi:hypothetical protein
LTEDHSKDRSEIDRYPTPLFSLYRPKEKTSRPPGLSVWLWGPPFWQVLSTIAYFSDTKGIYSSEELAAFFQYIQPLLPCPACSESYRGILLRTIAVKGSIQEVCRKRQLTVFVHQLHEFVNRKLLDLKWKHFLEYVGKQGVPPSVAALPADKVWELFHHQPTLGVVYKRQVFTSNEPLNLDSTWLLLLALVQRVTTETEINMTSFISILTQTLAADAFVSSRLMADVIRKCGSNTHLLFDSYHTWIERQTGTRIDMQKFLHDVQSKLGNMLSTGCGVDTCR